MLLTHEASPLQNSTGNAAVTQLSQYDSESVLVSLRLQVIHGGDVADWTYVKTIMSGERQDANCNP